MTHADPAPATTRDRSKGSRRITAMSPSPPSPEPLSIASSLTEEAEAIFRCFRVIRRRVLGPPIGMQTLPPSYLELMNLVRRHPGIRVGEAARTLRLAPNTVSTLARQLSGAGLLERCQDEGDHRGVRFCLTAVAQADLAKWRDQRLDLLAQALAELEPDDRAHINAALPALGRLVTFVRHHADSPGIETHPE